MKKIYLLIIPIIFLIGCSIANTPTSIVEDYLSKHQMLDKTIDTNYTLITSDTNLSQNIKDRYKNAIKKQYRDLSYEVKDEEIDGNNATVTVQVKVKDYKTAFDQYNKSDYSLEDYHEQVLNTIEETKEKTTYTIEFTLTKDNQDNWQLDTIIDETKNKLLGIY